MKKYKLSIARFPGSGSERMETVGWLIKTIRQADKDPRIEDIHSIVVADTPITASRNKAVLQAKANGSDYLLMVDSDMRPDLPYPGAKPFWDVAWEFMMERREKEEDHDEFDSFPPATIAAPYCGPPPDECVFIFRWTSSQSDNPNPDFRLELYDRDHAAIMSGIQEAAALPTGLILYDMRVFDVLPHPWFRYEFDEYESEKHTTEDVYQTRNASLLGLPQMVAWDSWAGHLKTKMVGKPNLVTRDHVHSSLVKAVKRGIDSTDRLIVLPPRAGAAQGVAE